MLRRVDADERPQSLTGARERVQIEPIVPAIPDVELEAAPLPHDHPPWVRDALTVSQRAKELIARLRPVVLRVLTFWDHRIRSIAIAGRRVGVDASGSYRVD